MSQRRAIDASGSIGSFYDIRRDCVLQQKTVNGGITTRKPDESIQWELKDGKTEESKNVLKMIGIDRTMRLNILLKSTPRTGIGELIDYPYPVDRYTRFLYISYGEREQRLPDDISEAMMRAKSRWFDADATHIISAVCFGMDIAIVVQLPRRDNTARIIDSILSKTLTQLKNSNDIPAFNTDNSHVLKKVTQTKVYSNITELTKMTSLVEIFQYIGELRNKPDQYPPLKYTLQDIKSLNLDAYKSCASYTFIEKNDSDKLEEYLIEILEQMKKIKHKMDCLENNQLIDQNKDGLLTAKEAWKNLQQRYENVIQRLKELTWNISSDHKNSSEIDQILKHNDQTTLKENIRQLMTQVMDLEKTTDSSTSNLKQQLFDEPEALETSANRDHNRQALNHKLIKENEQTQTISPTNVLLETNEPTSRTEQTQEQARDKQSPSSILPETQTSNAPSLPTTDETINILLLGESGVGKSTFINAFVNYLKFKTFEQAESSRPVVLIPVSFLITTGNNFDEHIVKFGDPDCLNNEDFDHTGQSVTQHCKSYLFDIDRNKGLKFRIIDTPGFGDTRGIDQDDLNMQHILEYINNFDHLNAICFLLKPNTSQINTFFRACLTQLLDLLGSNASQNIIFCFTNARSTFYAPGDTAPLLKDILKSLSIPDISFNKNNTFCFDNESFRYLVALQKSIKFDDQYKEEYQMSWSKSVNESTRLRNYIRKSLSACHIQDGKQSIKHAQFQITHMIRPMLEAMRNILRNMILYDIDSPNKSIKLKAKPLCRPAALCFGCERESIQKGEFWITNDVLHEIQKKCYTCDCASSQHKSVLYKLEYSYGKKSTNRNQDEMKDDIYPLVNASVQFTYFLTGIAHSSKDDPFSIGLIEMIAEENDICAARQPNEMNLELVKRLRKLFHSYEQRINNLVNQPQSKLSIIYEWIQTVCENHEVKIQMEAIRETQNAIMKLYEYKVPEDLSIGSTTTL